MGKVNVILNSYRYVARDAVVEAVDELVRETHREQSRPHNQHWWSLNLPPLKLQPHYVIGLGLAEYGLQAPSAVVYRHHWWWNWLCSCCALLVQNTAQTRRTLTKLSILVEWGEQTLGARTDPTSRSKKQERETCVLSSQVRDWTNFILVNLLSTSLHLSEQIPNFIINWNL